MEYTDRPAGEVLTGVPEGMKSFEQEYTIYVTSTVPVTVELERSTPLVSPTFRLRSRYTPRALGRSARKEALLRGTP